MVEPDVVAEVMGRMGRDLDRPVTSAIAREIAHREEAVDAYQRFVTWWDNADADR